MKMTGIEARRKRPQGLASKQAQVVGQQATVASKSDRLEQMVISLPEAQRSMEVQQLLRMTSGVGGTSYFSNSFLQALVRKSRPGFVFVFDLDRPTRVTSHKRQGLSYLLKWKTAIHRAKPIVVDAVLDLYRAVSPESLSVVDLGCSSGPNTFLVIGEIIDAIDGRCRCLRRSSPEFRVFLNDLPSNDFNTLFRSLPDFYEKLRKQRGYDCGIYLAAVPGSFYGRLFPDRSLHFVHSAAIVHWLSRVPPLLESEDGAKLNKGNIYIGKSSPPTMLKAYLEQFQRDFSLFLSSRSKEMVAGGRMVLALLGRRNPDPCWGECGVHWGLLAQSLNDMVSQGIVEEAKVTSYNMPYYAPSIQELKDVIEMDESFELDGIEINELNWDPSDDEEAENYVFDRFKSAENVAKCVRAMSESMLVSHFGEAMIEDLFRRIKNKIAENLSKEKSKHLNLVISMTKK